MISFANAQGNTTINSEVQKQLDDKLVTIYVNHFTEDSARKFYESFQKAMKSGQTILPIIIDSYGGSVDALVVMMELIESSPIPVATICIGKAMSCGAMLLSCGTEGMRYIAPTSRVMIHHVSSGMWGTVPDLKNSTEEVERLQKTVFEKVSLNCGQKKNYFLKILKERGNLDWYLTPEECVTHNLVNHIKVPELKTTIKVENVLV